MIKGKIPAPYYICLVQTFFWEIQVAIIQNLKSKFLKG